MPDPTAFSADDPDPTMTRLWRTLNKALQIRNSCPLSLSQVRELIELFEEWRDDARATENRILDMHEQLDGLHALVLKQADRIAAQSDLLSRRADGAANEGLRALVSEAIEKLPSWAGVNDEAHGWYVRAKTMLEALRS